METKIIFRMLDNEGQVEIESLTSEKFYRIYLNRINEYFAHKSKLRDLAYPKTTKMIKDANEKGLGFFDLFAMDESPIFDVDAKMQEDGYFFKTEYNESGEGFYETPFAKIITRQLFDAYHNKEVEIILK